MVSQTYVPQRFLANNRNKVFDATLIASAVQSVSGSIVELPVARAGTAKLELTGSYTGTGDANYDFRIIDTTATNKLVSSPVYTGVGSEKLTNIGITTAAEQDITVECQNPGLPATPAKADVGGAIIVARTPGVAGNLIHVSVNESGLVYDLMFPSGHSYTLINDLTKGDGSDAKPIDKPEIDFETETMGADNEVPLTALRVAFEGDRTNIYLQYKVRSGSGAKYYFIPELQLDYKAGSKVYHVTGSRDVTITNVPGGSTTETLLDIVTLFDLLDQIRSTSVLLDVDGIVVNDRTPSGMASLELNLRTVAHANPSFGTGSDAATGFTDIIVNVGASTETIVAECRAIDGSLPSYPNAHVTHELWEVFRGGKHGTSLGTVYTGDVFTDPAGFFSFVIPVRSPFDSGHTGNFDATSITYVTRPAGVEPPPICPVGLALGPNAVDKTITLTYTRRPPPDCSCDDLPVPDLNGPCLGTAGGSGGGDVDYTPSGLSRLKDLYDWARDLATTVTRYSGGWHISPILDSLSTTVGKSVLSEVVTQSKDGVTVQFSETITDLAKGDTDPGMYIDPANRYSMPPKVVQAGYADCALPSNFADLLNFYEDGLQQIDAVADATLHTSGLTEFDAALQAWKDDLDSGTLDSLSNRVETFATEKYKALVRRSMAYAGVSPKGKGNASGQQSGDGCWQDYGDGLYWAVVGSDGVKYAPAFNNKPYWSSKLYPKLGAIYSTKEFAFQLNIACVSDLLEGDQVILTIGNAGTLGTYQVDDELSLPIIAAQDLKLLGGAAPNPIQTWNVTGSVEGAFSTYVFNPNAPTSYNSNGVQMQLEMGGVPPAASDKFVFSVNGGHYQWRKIVAGVIGAWSVSSAIPAGTTAFDSGLSFTFIRGVSPSFVVDDMYSFLVLQPWQADNLRLPSRQRWYPGTVGSTIEAQFLVASDVDCVAIAMHSIPSGATITLTGGTTIGVTTFTEIITWQEGVVVHFTNIAGVATTRLATAWIRITLASAAGASIGWLWAGKALQTTLSCDVQLKRNYKIERDGTGGLTQGGRYLGKAINAKVEWQVLSETDATELSTLLDWTKSNDDEPLILVPQFERPQDSILATVIEDEVEMTDEFTYHPDAVSQRLLSAKVSLQGEWR